MERYIAIDNVCAWPNLTVLADGTLAVAIYNQPIHGQWRGDVEVWASIDDGRVWKKRGVAAVGEPPGNRMDVSAGCGANGDLIVISSGFSPVLEPGTYDPDFDFRDKCLDARVCRSADGERTWERADTVPVPDEADSWCIPFGDIVEGPNGLVSAFYSGPADDSRNTAWLLRSDDDGLTWGDGSIIAADDFNETTILHLGAGRWRICSCSPPMTTAAAGRTEARSPYPRSVRPTLRRWLTVESCSRTLSATWACALSACASAMMRATAGQLRAFSRATRALLTAAIRRAANARTVPSSPCTTATEFPSTTATTWVWPAGWQTDPLGGRMNAGPAASLRRLPSGR